MDEKTKLYFEALTKDREDSANTLEKPSMRGIQRTVVEKYSDQAHFIYELLQNADDVEATKVAFDLHKNELIFRHNGKRLFSVSNPATEDEDLKKGKLGDINSITSIANSNKIGPKIGKFGVGFKAVFQYTTKPMIYDPNFCFQISRFIVPSLLDKDYNGRQKDETIFVFPFDNPEKKSNDAYNDISGKLHNLTYPLLFLSKLNEIDLMIETQHIGKYSKKIEKKFKIGDIQIELICLLNQFQRKTIEQKLWLFTSSCYSNRVPYSISVGFFVDEKGQLKPVKDCAFCFFPTKETTNLNFIIHAPFLLTDSREGIKADDFHNRTMIDGLSKLAARSILLLKQIGNEMNMRLIDDNILAIIPINQKLFEETSNMNKISFKPFYTEILNIFLKEEIIPTIDGYTSKQNAYISDSISLIQLFSNEQLAFLSGNPKAKWSFISIQFIEKSSYMFKDLVFSYVKLITNDCLNYKSFLIPSENSYKQLMPKSQKSFAITANFIENQSFEWLHKFYKWIDESPYRTSLCKYLPIFIDSNKKAVSAFNNNNKLQLFLPFEGNTFYRTVHEELLKNDETKKFIEKFGITKPYFIDEIINVIIPKYENQNAIIDTVQDFKKIFKFYKECPQNTMNEFIKLVRNISFIMGYSKSKSATFRCIPHCLYFPSDFLFEYFETNPNALFINLDFYKDIVDEIDSKLFNEFLKKLGVSKEVKLIQIEIPYMMAYRFVGKIPIFTRYIKFTENRPDGFDQLFGSIKTNPEKSVVLWNYLLSICKKDLKNLEILRCDYFYYTNRHENFVSIFKNILTTEKWLLNSKNELVSPKEIFPIELKAHYDVNSTDYPILINFLEIKDKIINKNFSKEEQDDLDFVHELRESGVYNDAISLIKDAKNKKLQNRSIKLDSDDDYSNYEDNEDVKSKKTKRKSVDADINISNIKERSIKNGKKNYSESDDDDDSISDYDKRMKELKLFAKYANRFAKKFSTRSNSEKKSNQNDENDENDEDNEDDDSDEDDFIQPNRKHLRNRIVSEMIKNKTEIEKLSKLEELRMTAEKSTKYSYLWFKTLLQMELVERNYNNKTNRSISITFSKVMLEEGTSRTLILKHPNRYIPLYMEELSNIPLILHLGRTTKIISIEVINVQSYTIRAKFTSKAELQDIDLNLIDEAEINATNPVFLLEELRKSFLSLKFEDDFNMCDNLCQNIDFIFGPPGTGKTTYLAQNVIIPIMLQNEQDKTTQKVLVLTPTNKSADIIVNRIIDCMKDDFSYKSWLVRFGSESDETIEAANIHRDKSFNIKKLNKCVTVTTIHRFPYDSFNPEEEKQKLLLKDIDWDYIIFEEASMIPLINIIYPLYKQTPKKFIVSGDPFQIQPITTVDLWMNENIYTLVDLNSFMEPKTRPHQYTVNLLTTQYRSVPSVGNIYSKFTYGGILNHNRSEESIKKLNINEFINLSPLNIIKFPVSNFESIYKPKKLQNKSSYHVYCALFVFEFIQFLSQMLVTKNKDEKFTIGVIAAYRAQTDLIDKLFSSCQLPENINVQIGTIHGFQGDECDIVFAVFNPPPKISSSSESFLNNRNIINVSISRTRDFLFILMPDNKTENIKMLKLVKKVEKLCKQDECTEFESHELEKLIWGNEKFIENNSFSTSHQLVNVYSHPDKKYEIRCDDTAIDIFIK